MSFYNWKKMKPYRVNVLFGEPISSQGITVEELSDKVQTAILALQDKARSMK